MREIKFRAWDKTHNKMCESLLSIHWQYGNEVSEITADGSEGTYDRPSEEVVLMQYTNLKDKNGTEIYEADIVKMDSWTPSNMQISFIEGAFCLADYKGKFVGDIYYIHHAGIKQSEIIGNIYENPELVK